jgi:hypothetical protein
MSYKLLLASTTNFGIVKVDTGISVSSGEVINRVSFATRNVNYGHIRVVWDGANWQTITN